VFADGLLIPTGVLPDDEGGCYVREPSVAALRGHERRRPGNVKQIVMSSFGTEDTHHNLHTLRWGLRRSSLHEPVHLHAHARRDAARRRAPEQRRHLRFDPVTWRMEILPRAPAIRGPPLGSYGNDFFTDGGRWQGRLSRDGRRNVFHVRRMRREGESTSLATGPSSPAWNSSTPAVPDDWQGDAITCDFRAHRVVRFKLSEAGSSFAARNA